MVRTVDSLIAITTLAIVLPTAEAGQFASIKSNPTVVPSLPTTRVGFRQNAGVDKISAKQFRGGTSSCGDSETVIAIKTFIFAALETLGLVGVLAAGVALSLPLSELLSNSIGFSLDIFGLPLAQVLALFFVIFNSSFVGSFLMGGMSSATNQVLKPDVNPSPEWYSNLKKPWWNPPGWLFPIMWLIVSKPTQFWAVRKLFLKGEQAQDFQQPWGVLTAYCAHLALGDAWNNVFFGCQQILLGLKVILIFYGTLILSATLFFQQSPTAGFFMLPTCGWVTVATALNWSIYNLNNNKNTNRQQ